jgi:hypothetical protein
LIPFAQNPKNTRWNLGSALRGWWNPGGIASLNPRAVEEHHGEHSHDPPLSVIEVIGVSATDAIRGQLVADGFGQTEPDDQGFTAYRTL